MEDGKELRRERDVIENESTQEKNSVRSGMSCFLPADFRMALFQKKAPPGYSQEGLPRFY